MEEVQTDRCFAMSRPQAEMPMWCHLKASPAGFRSAGKHPDRVGRSGLGNGSQGVLGGQAMNPMQT